MHIQCDSWNHQKDVIVLYFFQEIHYLHNKYILEEHYDIQNRMNLCACFTWYAQQLQMKLNNWTVEIYALSPEHRFAWKDWVHCNTDARQQNLRSHE